MPRPVEYDDRPRRRPPRQDRTALWLVLGLLAAFGLLLVLGGGALILWLALGGRKGKPAPAAAEVAPAPPGWQEFRSPEGRFRVLLPGRPRVERRNMPSPAGRVSDTACLLDTAELSMGVAFADFDGPGRANFPLEAVVNAGRDAIAQRLGGRVVREGGGNLGGVRWREAVIDSARQGTCYFRWYLRGRRLYTVSVLGLHGTPPAETVQRFFDSFQLTD